MMPTDTQTGQSIASARRVTDPIVLCASDENYVRPLAVMLHSAASHLAVGKHLHVVLLDAGISPSSLVGLRETLIDLPVTIDILKPDLAAVADLATSHHITQAAYLRLMAATLLPESIERVIYLDSDVLVQDDLSRLWELPIGDDYCLAAVDISCPFVDARTIRDDDRRECKPWLGELAPIRNWRQLGIDGSAHYFNSGVLVLNLRQWRADQIQPKLFACLRDNAADVFCWDQYALNVVFAGRWSALPPRWNQGSHIFEYPSADHSPIPRDDFLSMRDNPAIIHYTTEFKPWEHRPFHPRRELYYRHLDQTAWAGWRPEKPKFKFRKWWNFQAVQLFRRWTVRWRKLKLRFNAV